MAVGDRAGSIDDELLAQLKDEVRRWQDGYELAFERQAQLPAKLRQAVALFGENEAEHPETAARILLGRLRKMLVAHDEATPKLATPLEMRAEHLQMRSEL